MNKENKRRIEEAFAFPEPRRSADFLRMLQPHRISMLEFIIIQIGYIRKSVWGLTLLIIGIALICAWRSNQNTEQFLIASMPFMSAWAVMETNRSDSYQMSEIEFATQFSLRSVIFARMIIMGGSFVVLLLIVSPFLATLLGASFIIEGMYLLIPYLVTMILSLHIERMKVGRRNMYLTFGIATGVSIVTLLSEDQLSLVMHEISCGSLSLFVLLLGITTVYECRKTLNNREVLI